MGIYFSSVSLPSLDAFEDASLLVASEYQVSMMARWKIPLILTIAVVLRDNKHCCACDTIFYVN